MGSTGYALFENTGIRSIKIADHGGGLAMVAYDTDGAGTGVDNEYLIIGDQFTIDAP